MLLRSSSPSTTVNRLSTIQEGITTARNRDLSTVFDNTVAAVFPQEIFDQILCDLDGDGSALSACSLTCRSLLSTARSVRFRMVALHTDNIPRCSMFVHLLEATLWVGGDIGVGQAVRELSLWIPDSEYEIGDMFFQSLSLMPNVCSLNVTHTGVSRLFKLAARHTLFPRLELLRLRNADIEDPLLLYTFLRTHSACQTVRYYQCSSSFTTKAPLVAECVLDTLSVKLLKQEMAWFIPAYTDMSLLRALLLPGLQLRIRRVEWSCGATACHDDVDLNSHVGQIPQDPDLGILLERIGSWLEELCVMLYPMEHRPGYAIALPVHTLSSATGLRRLELCRPGNEGPYPCPWVADALDQIALEHTALETICMICRGSVENYIHALQWERIDQALERLVLTLPRLTLEFEFRRTPGVWTLEEVVGRIMELLPRVRRSGVRPSFSLELLRPVPRLQPKVGPKRR